MLPANLIPALKTLAHADKPLITATPDKAVANAGKQLEVGQQVRGAVQAQVASGVFNVRVAEQMMQLKLPSFVKSGDTIQLQVVALLPRLTFTLAASSNPVSTPDSLSAAARMLSSLSQQPLERSHVRPIQSAPLWTGTQAQPDTAQLAGKLHEALSHSGLFYESHQAQWIAGTRPTAHLLLEPQNQLQPKPAAAPLANPVQASAAANTALAAEGRMPPTAMTAEMQRAAAPNIPEHLQTLVQQQMNALETRQVLWQGQVWQGQEMRWEVHEESPRHTAQGMEEGQWITRIDLDLPNLGGVSAQLSLTGESLSLKLEAVDEQTRDALGNAASQLVAALTERGIPVTQTQILRHEHAG
ncbi:MAG: flagellar hook-length control protein FliK [Pseudomonadota bacterium]